MKSKWKVLLGLSVVVVATAVAFVAAQRKDTTGARLTVLDYIEIQQLVTVQPVQPNVMSVPYGE